MNDVELAEALNKLYAKEDISSPERVERTPGLTAHLMSELFEVAEGMEAIIHYKDKAIYLRRERLEPFTEHEHISIPFKEIPSIIRFLAWACDEKPIDKE